MSTRKPGPLSTSLASLRATLRPRPTVEQPAPPPKGPVVWVLSGGGAMGAAQAGMAQVLFAAGVIPDVLVGCSAGALNAAAIAINPTSAGVADVARLWQDMAHTHPLDVKPFHAIGQLIRRRDHVIDPTPLRTILMRVIGERDLSEFPVPVHVVTTRLSDGQMTWHVQGPAVQILAASAALPGLLPPVLLPDGHLHVDGGVTDLVPVDRALDLLPSRVWVLDVAGNPGRTGQRHNALDVLAAGFAISLRQQAPAMQHLSADRRVTRIRLGDEVTDLKVSLRDFTKAPQLLAAGRLAARTALMNDPILAS